MLSAQRTAISPEWQELGLEKAPDAVRKSKLRSPPRRVPQFIPILPLCSDSPRSPGPAAFPPILRRLTEEELLTSAEDNGLNLFLPKRSEDGDPGRVLGVQNSYLKEELGPLLEVWNLVPGRCALRAGGTECIGRSWPSDGTRGGRRRGSAPKETW